MGYLVKPLRAQELSLAIELAITRVHEFVALREENSPERNLGSAETDRARQRFKRCPCSDNQ
jgi:AmiR/NasT family two-component response regulator